MCKGPLQQALLLFLCGSCFLILGTFAVKSKYVCQGQRLRLRCEGDYIIRILGAKYGRLEPGSSICPHENITDMNCRAPDVLLKMTVRCGNKRKCTVKADHTMFGDPCPGTFKYLDVIYRCIPGDTWTPTPTSKQPESNHHSNRTNTETPKSPTPKTTHPASTNATTETQAPTSKSSTKTVNETIGSNKTRIYLTTIKPTTSSSRGRLSTGTTEQSPPKAPESEASESRENPRHTLVVFLSGVAGATVFLLLFLLAIRLCKKQRKKKKFSMKNRKRDEEDEGNKIKSVTIELQGSDDETKEINVNPGDIIIIDHNDVDRAGSEDLGYLSEIVRFYNSQNIGSDDQISIRKQFSICDSPSVISTEASESRDSKHDSVGMKQCSCQHGSLLRPSSPLGVI
ncbi:latrophilin Cirl-like isoform X2 [Orbicella faveolata]|uniref:latrophilin Cirl-like isoform X2 n=1 Tax=Orbicella faveolata TaxID=48498 RepID=UPI0009E56CFA|nr:latrophilin Cirl-like isoform X2 [Orbicella faveolata]